MAKVKVKEDGRVRLMLTQQEASALMAITRPVGGHPRSSRRGLVDGIYFELKSARVSHGANDSEGSISFASTK